MRTLSSLSIPVVLCLTACGSGDGTQSPSGSPAGNGAFTPPALEAGYTRLLAKTVTDIAPGADVTHCQYVMAPVDHDTDVLDVTGGQSTYGHHAVAFSYVPSDGQEVGAELPCMMGNNEFTSSGMGTNNLTGAGTFLGGAGPVAGRVAALPEGVAFRMKKGEGVVLNLHYINTSSAPVSGDAYLDLKLADANPNQLIGALFVSVNGSFSIPPDAEADSNVDCVAQSDVNVIMMSNHMHEYGIHATTQVTRGDTGAVEVLHDDPTWNADMVNNPTFSRWSVDSPFVLHTGDTMKTSCSWNNTTANTLGFPREMCISAGFALASGDTPKAPACFNGTWVAQGI